MQPEKSNRQKHRERLKERLDSGRMTQGDYDYQIRRMKYSSSRGHASVLRSRLKLGKKLLAGGKMTEADHEQWVARIMAEAERLGVRPEELCK